MNERYLKQFIIFDEEDMKKLSEGLLVHQDFVNDPISIPDFECADCDSITTTTLHNSGELSIETYLPIKSWLKLLGIYDYVLENCSNKRVVYLAKYAKKKRTRTKNLNRAIKILAKEAIKE